MPNSVSAVLLLFGAQFVDTHHSVGGNGICGVLKQQKESVTCFAYSTLDIFNCMISILIFVCKITLEQVLHDLSIMMLFITTESILFGLNQAFFLIYFVCMIIVCQRLRQVPYFQSFENVKCALLVE